MIRSPMPPRKTPMRRSATRMRSSKPKMTPIRKSAKGQACTLHIVGICNYNINTTVWAHSNRIDDGKGMGIKARDEEGCYACSACHEWLDHGWARDKTMTFNLVQEFFDSARKKSQAILKQMGLMP